MKKLSVHEQKIARIFSPVVTAATLGLILAGCNPSTTNEHEGHDMSSSSSAAMMSSSVTSSDMMSSMSSMMMSSSSAATTSIYRDGMYSADGVYRSPAGGESVSISLTLKGDIVTAATFTGKSGNGKSQSMMDAFSSGFQEQVVGKSLDSVSVGVVNGSSLTGMGFMDAVAKIKAEAKA